MTTRIKQYDTGGGVYVAYISYARIEIVYELEIGSEHMYN